MCSAPVTREAKRWPFGPHVSYSGLSDFIKCPKYWELRREMGLPEDPSWWGVGGSAVHKATEDMDRARFERFGS